jgi:Phage tail tube protein
MASSNLELIAAIKEVTYGVTPAVGNFNTIRYTSETLSGTPQTTASAEARTDRASAGTLLTGLEVGGDINFELSSSATSYKDFMLAAMMAPAWTAAATSASTFTINNTAKTITDTIPGVDLTTIFSVGDALVITVGLGAANLNKVVYVASRTATVVTYIGDLTNQTAVVGTISRPEYAEVGGGANTTKHSFSIEKKFQDLNNRALDYLGALVGGMNLNFEFGALATGSFTFNAQNWSVPTTPITNAPRVVNPADTDNPINASGDMAKIIIDGVDQDLCFQSLSIELQNNLTPQTCLGTISAKDFTPGAATINVNAALYLGDTSFQYIEKKITNTPISIFGAATNANGGVAFSMPAVLLNSPDPQSGGANQTITLNLTGTTKAPSTGNQFRLYWI